MSQSIRDIAIVILSHHKCATNWIRSIANNIERAGLICLHTSGGLKKTSFVSAKSSAPMVALNVNAGRSADLDHAHAEYPVLHFVRDPRDALISNYWSWVRSHRNNSSTILEFRHRASDMSVEDGLLDLIEIFPMGRQLSQWSEELWARSVQIRYESMLDNFNDTVRQMFSPAGIHLDEEMLNMLKQRTSFSSISGRDAGNEDVDSHYRKGVPGDWKQYETPALRAKFHDVWGWLGERLRYW